MSTLVGDGGKFGRLAVLAAETGFDWAFFESITHVHASIKRCVL